MIIETEKSHNLLFESWRPRKVGGAILKAKNPRAHDVDFSLKI